MSESIDCACCNESSQSNACFRFGPQITLSGLGGFLNFGIVFLIFHRRALSLAAAATPAVGSKHFLQARKSQVKPQQAEVKAHHEGDADERQLLPESESGAEEK